MKASVLLAVAASAASHSQHPIRQEIYDEILLKATSWRPKPIAQNHLRHMRVDEIEGMLGLLGNTPFEHHSVGDFISGFKSYFGFVGDWRNWDVQDDDVQDEEREEVPREEKQPIVIH